MMKWSDGTAFDPPQNPLKEKWANLYPPCDLSDNGDFDYSCILCGKCPNGDSWEVPEEDKEIYNQWRLDFSSYVEEHGGLHNLLLEHGIDFNFPLINKIDTEGDIDET